MVAVGSPPEEQTSSTLEIGEVLVDELDGTKFQVHELIGRGGMGEVYRATRLSDEVPCAVKCVRRDLVQNQTILLRTRFEAKAFRMISHPNVVRVHGTGIRGDVPWMSMEWLGGFTLAEVLEKKGRIPVRWAVEIVRDLCQGLQAIHDYAVHRDIKPSNAHLGFDAVTRALDLGAAKSKEANVHMTSTGFQVGTLPFMAPEQLDNTIPLDHRADIWAAVVLLYMLMTGVHPFAVDGVLPSSKIKLGYSILIDPHRPIHAVLPSAPSFFSQIFDRGLAKDPEKRTRSAEELATVLTAVLDYLETNTGHAEPLSSLVDDLRSGAGGELWIPSLTTTSMPAPVVRVACAQRAPETSAAELFLAEAATEPVSIMAFIGRIERTTLVPPAPQVVVVPVEEAPAKRLPLASAPVLAPTAAEQEEQLQEAREYEEQEEQDWLRESKEEAQASRRESEEEAREEEEEDPPLEEEASGRSALERFLGDKMPVWLAVMMTVSAMACVTEAVYFWGPWRPAAPPPPLEPIAVPYVLPVVPGPEPTPVETATASPTAAMPTVALSSPPRPTAVPRLPRAAPPPPVVSAPKSPPARRRPIVID